MKRVMVYAYTHFNLGDDLFIKILCERYPQTTFVLYAPKQYKYSFKEINNLRVFSNDLLMLQGFNYVCRLLNIDNSFQRLLAKTCDAAILIGGSLFIQNDNWEVNLKNTKHLAIKGKPLF